MFWKYNASSSSQIEVLLSKEDVTLQEVMDSDDIINECRIQNKALIDFLQKPNVMEELVTLTTKEPSTELDERMRYKYSNIACELLTCDVPALNERLASDELLLDKLYNFLDNEPPLNPLLASFFSKILGALIAKKTEQNWLSYQFTCLQVLDFLKAKDTFISLLLKHLGTSAIMDLMLKLFTQVEGVETKQNILNWLDSQQIMQSLVSMFSSNVDKDRHYNVAQLLCDFIRIARDNQINSMDKANPLLNTLESSEIVAMLLEKILNGDKCESAIVGGIQVLLSLFDVNQNSISKFNSSLSYSNLNEEANDVEQKQRVLNNISSALSEKVVDFHNLLLEPPMKMPMELTVGVLDPPLGQTRLQVLKLFASVLSSNSNELLEKIMSLGTFPLMLDLFFKYPWNNFLHTQVERCLVLALKTYVSEDSDDTASALCRHLLENCKLIDRVLLAWKENDEQQKAKGVRQGYMGHLINILNELTDYCAKTYFGQYLKDNLPDTYAALEEFKEKTLNEVNETQRTLLGGAHPNSSNNNDNEEFSDSALSQSIGYQKQQMYAEFQMQYMNSRFIEGYSGFNDEAFNEGDDTLQAIDHRTDLNFDITDNAIAAQVFKQLCSQSINTLDDADDQIFEEKDHTFQTVIEKQGDQNEDQVYSSDSDDESPPEDTLMDVDPWTSPKPGSGNGNDSIDPWEQGDNPSNANVDTWADFTSVTFDVAFMNKNFDLKFPSKPTDAGNVEIEKTEEEKTVINDDETANKKEMEASDENEDETSINDKKLRLEVAAGDQGEKIEVKEDLPNEPSNITSSEGDCSSNEKENSIEEATYQK